MKQKYTVILAKGALHKPSDAEDTAARLLANYFKSDIVILPRTNHKGADFLVRKHNTIWELKSPTGKGKSNIQHCLHDAYKQSENVVLDGRFSKMSVRRFESEARRQFRLIRDIKRVILIKKSGEIVEIFR